MEVGAGSLPELWRDPADSTEPLETLDERRDLEEPDDEAILAAKSNRLANEPRFRAVFCVKESAGAFAVNLS